LRRSGLLLQMTTARFLTPRFLARARQTDERFNAALALLNDQSAAVNSNPRRDVWNVVFSPITHVLRLFYGEAYHQRSAQLIEAMYLRCGVSLRDEGPLGSDLLYAMKDGNIPALEVLLRKCNGVFTAFNQPLHFIQKKACFSRMLPLLRMLLRLRDILPNEVLDPNVLFEGSTVLHEAVRCDYSPLMDPYPPIVRVLVCEFGANPLFKDANGRTPLERLTATAASVCDLGIFETEEVYADWQARVAATKEILQRDRDVAVLLCKSSPASALFHLQPEMVRYIVEQTNQRDRDDADDLSS